MQRALAVRATALLVLGVLVVAAAVVELGGQPKVPTTPAMHPGAVPDVQCPLGVSPAQTFCYVGETPNSSGDTIVPPSTPASTGP